MRDLSEALDILKQQGWFSMIDERFQAALAAEARLIHHRKGEDIFHFGDPGAGLFGVVDGSLFLSYPREDGILLPFVPLGRGFWVGDLAVLSGRPGLVSISTQSDVIAVNIPARRVLKLVEQMPEIWQAFYELNRINIGLALRLLAALTVETAEKKIALRLLILSEYQADEHAWLPISNQELAMQLGLALPTVQRAIKRLEGRGALESGYSKIRILDRAAMIPDG